MRLWDNLFVIIILKYYHIYTTNVTCLSTSSSTTVSNGNQRDCRTRVPGQTVRSCDNFPCPPGYEILYRTLALSGSCSIFNHSLWSRRKNAYVSTGGGARHVSVHDMQTAFNLLVFDIQTVTLVSLLLLEFIWAHAWGKNETGDSGC